MHAASISGHGHVPSPASSDAHGHLGRPRQSGQIGALTAAMSEKGRGACWNWSEVGYGLHECKHVTLYEAAKSLLASGEELA